ncbi:anthranilate phosphoribosyltransferase [Natrarchaeobaculum aegyptiacum]|uniref:Anthranilate phosphoribosyltransferase n=1 Tax=Natrarchaeobaculum aegyptiacum TaxID=745377 RepID=A0A2Z2HZI5_9EURY|nr:anthranilate phosphoribosyltransferase [Natrarchaeobaculum aegyptiacum]ARS90514.1 anthranilate phosphoribosyltransferase [Natrarchaeobaculum aegyptiacum]
MTDDSQTGDEWPVKRLMTEVVGSGHKSAEDMTREQAREALERIFAGDPDETTLGAFWLANRWKRNTPEELGAYVDVMREQSVITAEPGVDPVDCGANYDGKHTTALLGVAAGVVAAAAGTPVVVHSGDRVPTQKATAYKHVLDALDVRTELEPAESAEMVDQTGFGFYYQPAFNPAVDDLIERRDEMGVRTFVNTIETLANPTNADVHLGSFYHLAFAKKMAECIQESDELEYSRAIFFQGMEGYDDIRPGYTKVAEWSSDGSTGEVDGELEDYEIETAAYGMDVERGDLAVEDVTADSASLTESVLAGEREDHFADAVALNGAFRIYARGDVDDLETGLERARDVLADGSAEAVLEGLRAF